jgi:LuxR family maltose regulon positive regulatory protein
VADAGGVALVIAEPGTGKTGLLRGWLATRDAPVAVGTAGEAVRALGGGTAALVVADDAHALDADARVALGDALARRPDGVAAVVAARADLGLCVEALRRRGPVLLLDGDDLALDARAVRAALQAWGWEAATAAEAHAVAYETDGWCAGVRLLAAGGRAGLRAGARLPDLLHGLVDAATRAELVALSELDVVDPPGVAAVLGGDEAQAAERLRRLVAARVFLRRGPVPGTWRFARPVLRALRRELAAGTPRPGRSGGGALADMGAALLEDDALAGQAVGLLLAGRLAAPGPEALAAAGPLSPAGRAATALALLEAGDADTARAPTDGADACGPGVDGDVALALGVAAARAAGDRAATLAAAERVAARARADGDPRGLGLEAYAVLQHALLDLADGRTAAADERLAHAAGLAERAGAPGVFSRARVARARLALAAGRLVEARRLADSVPADGPQAETRARRALVLGAVAYQRDDLVAARERVAAAREAAAASRSAPLWFDLLLLDALVHDAEGDDDRAFERLAEAAATHGRCPVPPRHGGLLELLRVRLLARAGRASEAGALLERLDAERDAATAPLVDLAVARRALADGRPGDASHRLHPWAVAAPVPGLDVWHLVAFALAADRLGDPAVAHDALERALDRAVPEGARRPFVDGGRPLDDLLARHLEHGTAHAGFGLDLRARLATARGDPDGELRSSLTDRERVVLGYLPTELSAPDIAAALHISEATVRTHMHNIYAKLAVSSRRNAVARARELRMLSAQQT